MEQEDKRGWYKMKRTWVIATIVLSIFAFSGDDSNQAKSLNSVSNSSNSNTANVIQAVPKIVETVQEEPTPTVKTITTQKTSSATKTGLSNSNYYVNTDGNTVHSPAYSTTGSIPSGASAKCRDGTYSFSQHRQGTCSGHGGVASWL